jgi:quinol monooxygenase YgiN
MFAQVVRFKSKEDRWNHIENEIVSFRDAIKAEGIPIKTELVLRSRKHNVWMAIALFDNQTDLDRASKHPNAQRFLENLKTHIGGEPVFYEAEVFELR